MDTDQVDITVSRVLFKLLIVCCAAYQGHYVWKEMLLLNVIVLGFEHHKKNPFSSITFR